MKSIEYFCISSSTLGFETQCLTIFDDIQEDNKMKLRRVTLPDGTKKLEVVPLNSKDIEERRIKIKEENKKIYKNICECIKELVPNRHIDTEYIINLEKRFWEKVNKNDVNKCWIWDGSKDKNEYGLIRIYEIYFKAHRISYLLYHGKLSENKLVLHRCDNSSCVNPNHLYEGTDKDNSNDRRIRNRGNRPIGELNPMSKLTSDLPDKIREEYFGSKATQKILAKKYGISRSEISHIINNKVWKVNKK